MKRNIRLIWRGALGGALGAPIFLIGLALHDKLRLGHVPYGGALEFVALPTFLLIGAIFGALIGGIIWVIETKLRRSRIPAIIRALIGAAFILLVVAAVQLLRTDDNGGLIPPTIGEVLVNLLMYVACFGALPGIAARPRILEDEIRTVS